MIAMVMLRLRCWLVNMMGRAATLGGFGRAIAIESAAQEAVDQNGSLLRATGKAVSEARRACVTPPLPALFALGVAFVPFAGIRLARPIVAFLVARAPLLVA